MVKQAQAGGSKEARMAEQRALEKKRAADEKKRAEEEMALLLKTVIVQPKLAPGVDPKSVVCEFWRAGQCKKGASCKYAHDLAVERKGPKINLYEDQRDGKEEEGMEDWTQEELEKAIAQKHGDEKTQNKTNIVCKFFIEAVEKRQYGWFWSCPNGGKSCQCEQGPGAIYAIYKEAAYTKIRERFESNSCSLLSRLVLSSRLHVLPLFHSSPPSDRHALPPGYVLPSQMKAMLQEEAAKSRDITEILEEERQKCHAVTKITDDVFKQWRAKKDEERKKKVEDEKAARTKAGRVTGREMFETEGFEARDDDAAGAADDYAREVDEDAEAKKMEAEAIKLAAELRAAEDGVGGMGMYDEGGAAGPSAGAAGLTAEEEAELFDEDGDDIDLDELEADLAGKATIVQ